MKVNTDYLKIAITFLLLISFRTLAQETFKFNVSDSAMSKLNVNQISGPQTGEVQAFLPSPEKRTGRAILICPGGAYAFVATDHEGVKWAPFLNKMGIAVFVLNYHLPNENPSIPLNDVEKAIKTINENSKLWGINPADIGIMGFSAGGHLTSTAANRIRKPYKPAFQILFYPVITMDKAITHMGSHDNLLGKNATSELEMDYSNERQVNNESPAALIILSADDKAVLPQNSINYANALLQHHISTSLHLYPTGGHGWGFDPKYEYHNVILDEIRNWLSHIKPKN